MQYISLGTTDISVSTIAFGAWAIGGWMWGGTEEKTSMAAINTALDAGINFIDTAPMYGFGRSEEIIGKAIKGKRNQFVLATKCGLRWDTKDWPEGKGALQFYSDAETRVDDPVAAPYRVYRYLHPDSIREEVELSLRRLGTDYIDLLQTHWQDPTTPLEDYVGAMHRLTEEGKIRAIGCCNATVDQIAAYQKVGPLDADQEKLSLLDRAVLENGVLDACQRGKTTFLAYSPLANGILTGKFTAGQKFGKGDFRAERERFRPENIKKVNERLARVRPIAEAYGLNLAQLAIAWTRAKYEKTSVLCGIRTPEQARENAQAGNVTIKVADIADLERIVVSEEGKA